MNHIKLSEIRLALLDDDSTYLKIMDCFAETVGVQLDVFSSFEEMGVGRLADFDALIIDYNLGDLNALDIAEYVENFVGFVPIIVVSGSPIQSLQPEEWPATCRGFISKTRGYRIALEQAIRAAGDLPTKHGIDSYT